MLQLTDNAVRVLDALAARSDFDDPGLRLTQREDSTALTMGLAEAPRDEDEVVSTQGTALVFLDPVVLPRLDGAVLDAKSEPGAAAFFLRED